MSEKMTRIPGADGLRTIACLLVVWHHTTQRFNPEGSAEWLKSIHFLGMRGEVGVSLFFVLSGCLLSLPFWNSFIARESSPRLRSYALNRAARILPAYWINLLLCTYLALWIFDLEINWWRLISGLLFLNSYHYSTFFPAELNGPLWSIGLEVSCYVLLPLVLFTIIKSSKKISHAFVGLIGWIVLLQVMNPWLLNRFMTSDDLKGWEFGLTGGAKQWLPYWNVDTFFSQFLCGSLAALAISTLRSRNVKTSLRFDVGALLASLSALLLITFRLEPGAPDSFTNQPYAAPIYSLLVACVLFLTAFSRYLSGILDNRLFRWIAKLSFSIYLWHMVIIVFIERKASINYVYYGLTNTWLWVLVSSAVLLGSILIASASWQFIESPILKKARGILKN